MAARVKRAKIETGLNEVDSEFMKHHFRIDDEWWWVPSMCLEKWTRESPFDVKMTEKTNVKINPDKLLVADAFDLPNAMYEKDGHLIATVRSKGVRLSKIITLLRYGLPPNSNYVTDSDTNEWTTKTMIQYKKDGYKPVKRFKRSKYIKLKRYTLRNKIFKYDPGKDGPKIYIHKRGKHIVMDKKVIKKANVAHGHKLLRFTTFHDGKKKGFNIHLNRLMWLNAHPEVDIMPETIEPIDGDTMNCDISNLQSHENQDYKNMRRKQNEATKKQNDKAREIKRKKIEAEVVYNNNVDSNFMDEHFKIDDDTWYVPAFCARKWTRGTPFCEEMTDKLPYTINRNGEVKNLKGKSMCIIHVGGIPRVVFKRYGGHLIHVLLTAVINGLPPSKHYKCDRKTLTYKIRDDICAGIKRQRREQIPIESFVEEDYIEITRVPHETGIFNVHPTKKATTIHAHKYGDHFVFNRKFRKEYKHQKSDYPKINVRVMMNDKKKTINLGIHRLVWLNAHPEVDEMPESIDHVNANKHDWSISNLQAVTASENCNRALYVQKTNPRIVPVRLIDVNTNQVYDFESISMAARFIVDKGLETKVTRTHNFICKCTEPKIYKNAYKIVRLDSTSETTRVPAYGTYP